MFRSNATKYARAHPHTYTCMCAQFRQQKIRKHIFMLIIVPFHWCKIQPPIYPFGGVRRHPIILLKCTITPFHIHKQICAKFHLFLSTQLRFAYMHMSISKPKLHYYSFTHISVHMRLILILHGAYMHFIQQRHACTCLISLPTQKHSAYVTYLDLNTHPKLIM